MKPLKLSIFFLFISFFSFSAKAQITNGLVYHWSFNGNAIDSISGNNGEIFGNVSPTIGLNGQDSTAMFFDGSGDYIKISAPTFTEMTISFWMKPFDLWDDDRLISSLDGTTNGFSLRYYSATVQIWSPWRNMMSFIPDPNQWYFITLTINSLGQASGYFNGALHYQGNISFDQSSFWGIGSKLLNQYGNNFHGTLDEFKIYNRVLTQSEIDASFDQFKPNKNFQVNETIFWNEDKLGIGTENPDEVLTVKGNIHAIGAKVNPNIPVPDYVFDSNYSIKSIEEVKEFIDKNGHLPDITPADDFKSIDLGEMDLKLLLKIEELTLYMIDQQKRIDSLLLVKELKEIEKLKMDSLKLRVKKLESIINEN